MGTSSGLFLARKTSNDNFVFIDLGEVLEFCTSYITKPSSEQLTIDEIKR